MKFGGIALALCTVLVGLALPASASTPRVLVPRCGHLVYRPADIPIACADGGYVVAKLHWHTWTSRHATATASVQINDCTPNCATGHFHSYRANVTLYAVRCGRYFTRLQARFPYGGPGGKSSSTYALH